jgi:hypothetical protein
MRVPPLSLSLSFSLVAASLFLVACAASGRNPAKTGTAGTGTGAAGTGVAGMGAAGTGTTGAAGTGAAGTTGAAGASPAGAAGTAGSGAAGATTGAAGTGTDGGTDAPAHTDGPGATGEVAGPVTTAGCANHNYQLCIDFESGIDTATWTGGTAGAIVTTEFAHGTHSYRLYSDQAGVAKGGRLLSTKVGTIKNQVWARFYIHFKPGAPGGHGNIVAAYDQGGNWYEMGYQFDGMMGVWHGGGGELPLRSMPLIVDQWYCIETYFDGAAAVMPKWWIDGTEAAYYNPGGGPKVAATTQFMRLEAGFTPYAGLGLKMPDGKGDQTETRVLTDLWIDDIAFDTQRIGCIQ